MSLNINNITASPSKTDSDSNKKKSEQSKKTNPGDIYDKEHAAKPKKKKKSLGSKIRSFFKKVGRGLKTVLTRGPMMVLGGVVGALKAVVKLPFTLIKGAVNLAMLPFKLVGKAINFVLKLPRMLIKGVATLAALPFKLVGGAVNWALKLPTMLLAGVTSLVMMPFTLLTGGGDKAPPQEKSQPNTQPNAQSNKLRQTLDIL